MAGGFKLGFDARMVEYTGIGTYIKNLLSEYRHLEFLKFVSVYGSRENGFLSSFKGAEIINAKVPVYSIREQVYFKFRMRKDNPVFHSPHYNAPLFYRGKLVLTIHDLIHLKYPEYLPSRKARLYANFMLKRVSRKASRIITSSMSSKKDIINILKVPADKITVIPLGADKKFHPVEDMDALRDFRTEYGLGERFILYAGNMKKHKNLILLLDVYENLKKGRRIDHSLVLAAAGRADAGFVKDVRRRGLGNDIKILPFIPDAQMPLLYNCADIFVFPSLDEGFGLPPLEAFACGVPSVVSSAPALREVAGDAAVLCDAGNAAEFEKGIYELLTDKQAQDTFRNRGLARAAKFSWKTTAEKTINVYNECLCD